MAEDSKLLGFWGSPFSRTIEVALELKSVKYEYIEEDIINKSPRLLKYNPVHKKVPVLVHNDKPIAESLVILEYIDEIWKGNPIFPEDPYQRATARFWTRFIDDQCLPTLWNACWSKGEEQEKTMEEGFQHLKTLENELNGKKFFGGETIGPIDMAANFIAYWLLAIQEVVGVQLLTKEKFPKLYNWSVEYTNCSVIKEHLPPRDELIAYFKAHPGSPSATN